jgi:hypothetical protein
MRNAGGQLGGRGHHTRGGGALRGFPDFNNCVGNCLVARAQNPARTLSRHSSSLLGTEEELLEAAANVHRASPKRSPAMHVITDSDTSHALRRPTADAGTRPPPRGLPESAGNAGVTSRSSSPTEPSSRYSTPTRTRLRRSPRTTSVLPWPIELKAEVHP